MEIPLIPAVRKLLEGEPLMPGDLLVMQNEEGWHTKVVGVVDAEHQPTKWRLIGPDGHEMNRNYSD